MTKYLVTGGCGFIGTNLVIEILKDSQNIVVNIDKETKRMSLSLKATLENPWKKIADKVGEEVKIKISNITDKAIFGEIVDFRLSGMLHYKEISYNENVEDLKKFKKNESKTWSN